MDHHIRGLKTQKNTKKHGDSEIPSGEVGGLMGLAPNLYSFFFATDRIYRQSTCVTSLAHEWCGYIVSYPFLFTHDTNMFLLPNPILIKKGKFPLPLHILLFLISHPFLLGFIQTIYI